MPKYDLTLFGSFDLRDDRGEPVKVVSKKGRCLLACLALAQGQSIHRDRLAGLLWGDRDDEHARHSLSQALYRLRGLFPEDIQAGFSLSPDTVGLAADLFDVDVLRFEAGLNGRDQEAVEAALPLYTGELLAGLEINQEGFDDWLATERERLRDRAIAGWRNLMKSEMEASPDRAVEAAMRLLTFDAADEDAHRALMQLYVSTGRRDLALRQYQKCEDVLQTELGVEPSAETKALYEQISTEPTPPPPDQATDAPPIVEETSSKSSAPLVPTVEPKPAGAERRQVTVLQYDLVISTSSSEPLDPEDRGEAGQTVRETCAQIVKQYEGSIIRPAGDGFLACFGFPRAHEDDAARAVHAGLAIVQAVPQMEPHPEAQLTASVGIATGLVVTGDRASDDPSEERAISGEAPSLATRLQTIAEPGSVLVSESTQRLLDAGFEVRDLGAQEPVGKSGSVRAWHVIGHRPVESRFEAGHKGALTAFVGREIELHTLLHHWERVKEGEGQVVLISGEPGIGKSRITQTLHERLPADGHIRLVNQCSPHHVNSALHPVIQQITFAANIAADDPPPEKLDKLEALLGQAIDDPTSAVPLLADLLSIPASDRYPALHLTPEAMKQRTLEALIDQLLGLANTKPVLFVFEDLHWADPTTQELLDLTVERLEDARVLALFTFRPEYDAPWVGQSHVRMLSLSRLSKRECAEMARRVAADAMLPEDAVGEIVAKTDGVPLFVEELTKTLLSSDVGQAVPTTIQASLTARLDQLGPSAKKVAQIGAVLGREFSYTLLSAVAELEESDLRARLDALTDSQLIFARGRPPNAVYTFKHALVQDAAYDSLLRGRRRELHARTAETLLGQFRKTAEGQPELLAHHFTEADRISPAVYHWQNAAERSLRRSSTQEAVSHAKRGLALVDRLGDARERSHKRLTLQTTLATAYGSLKGFTAPETVEAYNRARKLVEPLRDSDAAFPIYLGIHAFHVVRAEFHLASEIATTSLELARKLPSVQPLIFSLYVSGLDEWLLGRPQKSRRWEEQAVNLSDQERPDPLGPLYGEEPTLSCRNVLSVVLVFLGCPVRATSLMQQTYDQAKALAHTNTLGHCSFFGSIALRALRNWDTLLGFAREALTLTEEQHLPMWEPWARCHFGLAKAATGDLEKGHEILMSGVEASLAQGPLLAPYQFTGLAEVLVARGRSELALDALEQALAHTERTDERWWLPETHRVRGLTYVACGAPDKAEASYSAALKVAREQGARWFELRAARDLASLWHDQGKTQEARDLLAPVYNWFTEGFDTPDLKEAKALLEELS